MGLQSMYVYNTSLYTVKLSLLYLTLALLENAIRFCLRKGY